MDIGNFASRVNRVAVFLIAVFSIAHLSLFGVDAFAADQDESNRYVVTLESYASPVDPLKLPKIQMQGAYRLYVVEYREEGRLWYRLRLGFFPTADAAQKAADELHSTFASPWVSKASRREVEISSRLEIAAGGTTGAQPPLGVAPEAAAKGPAETKPGASDRAAKLMEDAERYMKDGQYHSAIRAYKKVLQMRDARFASDAQEFLGLARERSGDIAGAEAEYRAYLVLYPKGEAADRVRQRLNGLLTALDRPKEELKKAEPRPDRTDVYGTLSQFYNYDQSLVSGGEPVKKSAVLTDIDLNTRKRGDRYDVRTSFSGGYELDLHGGASGSKARLSQLYYELNDRQRHLSMRAGRQSQTTGGVLGRFDGVRLSHQWFPSVKANFVTGFPVASATIDTYDLSHYFYGVNFDLGTFAERFDFNVFLINQFVNQMVDRRAVGGEMRYFQPNAFVFALVDYDISYRDINTALVTGNWTTENKTTFTFTADYRLTPTLTTSNAMIGQGVEKVRDLREKWTEAEIRWWAKALTPSATSFSLGLTRPWDAKFQVGGDVTVTEVSGLEDTSPETPNMGREFFYNLQLIGTSLFKEGDMSVVGLRYSVAHAADTLSLSGNARYPVNHVWRLNPKLVVDYIRKRTTDGGTFKIRPALRSDYNWRKDVTIEFEGGLDWSWDWASGRQTDLTKHYFFLLGYRMEL